jgi:hypothetical protein
VGKQPLQLIEYAVVTAAMLSGDVSPIKHELPQLRCHVEGLKQAIHVARGTLIA